MHDVEAAVVRECRKCRREPDVLGEVFWEAPRRKGQGPGEEYLCRGCRS